MLTLLTATNVTGSFTSTPATLNGVTVTTNVNPTTVTLTNTNTNPVFVVNGTPGGPNV